MLLAYRESDRDGAEKRTFKCPMCGFIRRTLAEDPFKSGSIARLAHSLKRPE
jgi:hypothetical protein